MQTAFEVLGLRPDADERAIRSAYHQLAKTCHPDKFQDPAQQQAGQQRLIAINLAYEQAMKIAASRQTPVAQIPLQQAKDWARKLLERKQYELALLQLSKAEGKDAQWYALQARTLVGLKQYLSAHQAWRTAVHMDPDNLAYRREALSAEMLLRRSGRLPRRVISQLKNLFRK
ncbi:MAG: J domain-containing protein [Clostridiales bacterium]|nr:J domain-containing protein [Clostridiales bacterium]